MTPYNGWTNYATWRVNLEIFDGLTLDDLGIDVSDPLPSAYDLAQVLRDYTAELFDSPPSSTLVRNYADAFLQDVDWVEIADHLLPDYLLDDDAE